MFKLANNRELGKELRVTVVETLADLMESNQAIIALEADLGAASKWSDLKKEHANRLINMGIAEANMVGVAAGLSLTGFIPFIHTFGLFATRRVLDQLYLSGAYGRNTINIFGSDPGFAVGHNGGTHTTWEDVALLRTIPEVVICDAADEVQMAWIINAYSKMTGIHYVRGNRKAVKKVYEAGSTFEIGKGNVLRKGNDYLIIAAGQLVSEALEVADYFVEHGITSTVIDMFTIKPLDRELIEASLVGKKGVVTIENHSIIGGLGSGVAEVMAEVGTGIPLFRIGAKDQFGQVGTPEFLQKAYGLTTQQMIATLGDFIK